MPSSPSLRAPCIHARLRRLAMKRYEISGSKEKIPNRRLRYGSIQLIHGFPDIQLLPRKIIFLHDTAAWNQ